MSELMLYDGKSKTIFASDDKDSCIIRFKNTATAFNGEKKEELTDKGKLNAAISNKLFDYLSQNGIKTHIIKVIDDVTILVKKTEIIPIEVIVRNLAAGSFSKKYGVEEGSSLKNVIVEFSIKSDELGDPMTSASHITALSLATEQDIDIVTTYALKINELLKDLFKKAGIILVDFKLEFGKYKGDIILCDEISPDSCRLWDESTLEKLDKDRFRRDLGKVMESYAEVLRRIENV